MRRLMFFLVVLLCLSNVYLWVPFIPNHPPDAIASVKKQSDSDSPTPSSTAESEEEPDDEAEQSEDEENTDSEDEGTSSVEQDDIESSDEGISSVYQAIVEEFFSTLESNGSEAALEQLFDHNPYADRLSDQIAMLSNQYSSAESVMGTYRGYELLIETKVADRVVHQQYLVMYDRQPLRFDFAFYKAEDEWSFQNFAFSSDVMEEIMAMSNIALLGSEKVQFYPVPEEEYTSLAKSHR